MTDYGHSAAGTSTTFDAVYKYGPEPGNPLDHWYEYLFDGTTDAEVFSDRIVLHFIDGERGDDATMRKRAPCVCEELKPGS